MTNSTGPWNLGTSECDRGPKGEDASRTRQTHLMISLMMRKLSFSVAAVLALSACASANKRFGQGQDLENQGRPAEAAERYIQALKKDSRQDSARAGLRRAGAAALGQYMATATNPAT